MCWCKPAELEGSLDASNNNDDDTNKRRAIFFDRALYLGRISCGLCDLSPSLQRCMIQDGEQTTETSTPTSK